MYCVIYYMFYLMQCNHSIKYFINKGVSNVFIVGSIFYFGNVNFEISGSVQSVRASHRRGYSVTARASRRSFVRPTWRRAPVCQLSRPAPTNDLCFFGVLTQNLASKVIIDADCLNFVAFQYLNAPLPQPFVIILHCIITISIFFVLQNVEQPKSCLCIRSAYVANIPIWSYKVFRNAFNYSVNAKWSRQRKIISDKIQLLYISRSVLDNCVW